MSGLSDIEVEMRVEQYLDQFGRYPELDELPNVDSSNALKEELGFKTSNGGTNYISTDTLLEKTNSSSIQEAVSNLNNSHRDLEIQIRDLEGVSFITIKHRPSEFNSKINSFSENISNDIESHKIGLISSLDRLRNFYGVNIEYLENVDKEFSGAKAFIQNGVIKINLDEFSIDSPIHEMLHMFLGSVSLHNPNLFGQLVNQVEQLPNYEELLPNYPNRTRQDINEEIFVEELAKYITGQKSMLDLFGIDTLSSLMYDMKRDIDTIIDGNYSVKSLDENEIFGKSLKELANILESDNFNIKSAGSLTSSYIHRMLANTKENLLKSGELQEQCV